MAQRVRLQEKLGRRTEALTGDLKVFHEFLSRGRILSAPYVATRPQLAELTKTWDALQAAGHTNPEKLQEMFGQIEQLVSALEVKDTETAKKKLELLMALPIVQAAIAHEKKYGEVMEANVVSVAAYADVEAPKNAEAIRFLFGIGKPLPPPAGAPAELTKEYEALAELAKTNRAALAPGLRQPPPEKSPDAGKQLVEFAARYAKYEVDCRTEGRKIFLKEMGFPADCTEEELNQFIISLARPVLPPAQARDPAARTKPAVLAQYAKLNEERVSVSNRVALAMRRNLGGEVGKNQVEGIVTFLVNRDIYERKVIKQPQADNDQWLLYMGVIVNEAAEEILEEYISWEAVNKRTLQKIPILRDLAPATRTAVIKGWEQVCAQMGKVGMPVETLGKLFGAFNRMPLGPKFWGELLAIESPVTVLLWGLYMHESPNKVKATMQFASFIMVGKATSKAALAAGNALRVAGILKHAPKNPYVLFAIGMGVAFASQDTIEKVCTWADKNIPESATKDVVGNLLATISGDFAFGGLEELAEITGVSTVDPDRDFRNYMTRPANLASPSAMLTGDYYHTVDDWNKRVDQTIAKGEKESPIALKLWELRKIGDVKEWAKAQSVPLHIHVTSLASQESELESGLRAAGAFSDGDALGGLELATRDGGKTVRNDNLVRYAWSGTGKDAPGLKKAAAYFDGLIEKAGSAAKVTDPLFKAYQGYRDLLGEVAKDVSLCNYLEVYDRKTWLNDLKAYGGNHVDPTDYVRSGLVQSIADAMRRNRAVSRSSYPDMKPEQYGAELAKALKTEQKISLIDSVGQDFETLYKEWKGPGINIFKGAQSLNIPSISIRDELFQLMMQIHAATKELGESLSKDVADALLADAYSAVQQLASSREIITSAQLRAIRTKLSEAVLKGKVSAQKVWKPNVGDRFRIGSAPLLVQGDLPGLLDMDAGLNGRQTVDYVRSFVNQEAKSESDSLHLLQSRSETGDLQLFSFDCRSSDRSRWHVRFAGAQRQFYYRGRQQVNSVTYTPSRDLTFADFCKTYPGSAAGLEEQFKVIEAREKKREEDSKSLETKRDEEKAKLKSEYISANEGERMKGLEKVILYRSVPAYDRLGAPLLDRDRRPIYNQVPIGNAKDLLAGAKELRPKLEEQLKETRFSYDQGIRLSELVEGKLLSMSKDSNIQKECEKFGTNAYYVCMDVYQSLAKHKATAAEYERLKAGDYWERNFPPFVKKELLPLLDRLNEKEMTALKTALALKRLTEFEKMLNEKGAGALREGLEKDATAHAEKIAGWRLEVRAACQSNALRLLPVAPGSKEYVTVGGFNDPKGEKWIVLSKPTGYKSGDDSNEINTVSSKIHQPDDDRKHYLRYYRIKAKDVADPTTLNFADIEKNTGWEKITMDSDMLYSDLGDDWKRLAKHVLLNDHSGGTSAHLYRILNLFPYQIAWSDRSNAKEKLHNGLWSLSVFVKDDAVFYEKLISTLIELKTGDEKGTTWGGVNKIYRSIYLNYTAWGMSGTVRGEPETVVQMVSRVLR
ncbi:MAG: hypothetical protein KBC95_01025 [Candidatus Peribacteraceae bacterium]|nr:hypothetical protein [Candidatus Peribacteraceae bacterium]